MKTAIPGLQKVVAFVKRHQSRGIESTGASVAYMSGTMYNVSNSTDDPKKIPGCEGMRWKPLLIKYGIDDDCYVVDPHAGGTHPQFNVGGHVTPNADGVVAPGGICYLMPMCSWHNHYSRDGVPFQHVNTKMLKLTGYDLGELAATFQLRLPSPEPFALLYYANCDWHTIDLTAEQAAHVERFVHQFTGQEEAHYVLFERVRGGEKVLHYIRDVSLPSAVNWNQAFTNLIRQAHANAWGNWQLDASIAVGAVGYVDPDTGSFVQVTSIDQARFKKVRLNNAQDWVLESSGTQRSESTVDFEGGYLDPSSGVEVTVGTQIKWGFSDEMGLASNASVVAVENMDNFGVVLQNLQPWLAGIAKSVGYGDGTDIVQGFGVITSAIIAGGVVNVASEQSNNTFSITGSVDGVAAMTGDGSVTARLGGSYKDTNSSKSVDSHIYPSQANTRADGEVAIAFNFASFDGQMILPSWVQKLDPLSICCDNAHGGTYIADVTVTYNYEVDGKRLQGRQTTSVPGGQQSTIGGIPLNATNLQVAIHFEAGSDFTFTWQMPCTSWLSDTQTIDMSGVWPWGSHAVVRGR